MTKARPGHELWYRGPALEWTDAIPLGNGRLGAMVYGGVPREELQLNEDTLWSGGPYVPTNPTARSSVPEIRELLFMGRYAEAEAVANADALSRPYQQMSFQPAGRLLIECRHNILATDYRRSLDLDRAVSTTSYKVGAVTYRRETFISCVAGLLVSRFTADQPGALEMFVEFVSEQPGIVSITSNAIAFTGRNRGENGVAGALTVAAEARILAPGAAIHASPSDLHVQHADAITILLDVATSFRRFDDVSGDPFASVRDRIGAAADREYQSLLDEHVAEHQRLYRRMDISLGGKAVSDLPTDERIQNFALDRDPGLASLYVRYGRYLAISSSRAGTQPANLQGIWNKEIRPPWGSKYTVNINTQMNYWLADAANLPQCVEPLIAMVEDLAEAGAEMARCHYGASGWVLHHNTDLWRASGPIDGAQWGLWPTGGAWLCAQLWDHARFAGFPDQLVRRLFPLLKGASSFFLDTLVALPGSDLLVTSPSISPENLHPHGASICYGPAMDSQILRDLFDATIEAAAITQAEDELVTKITSARSRLPADRVGSSGQLQEWLEDWDMAVPEIHHRHVSHLYGLYPSLQFSPDRTPRLATAARKSLEIRGDDATGWGIGWRINLWARLNDGDHAHKVLERLLHPERSYKNLFDAHPPFQIDGNFGGAAGIIEMLVQSDGHTVKLLPALPSNWTAGALTGVRVRGGVELDFSWSNGTLSGLVVRSSRSFNGSLFFGEKVLSKTFVKGETTYM